MRRRPGGFRFALHGWRLLARTTPNAWIHVAVAALALTLGLALEVPAAQIALVVLAIGLVLVTELVNTAIEATVDLATHDHHPLAGAAKDLAAGAVLAAAAVSVIVGLLVFGPRVVEVVAGG